MIFVLIAAAIILVAWSRSARSSSSASTQPRPPVTIFRGVPYELPFGIELYARYYDSGVTIDQVAAARRETFTDHKLRSLDDASDLVRQLETGRRRMSARNRELLALVPASLLVTAGFAAIFIQRSETLSDVSLTYGAVFLALCVAGHVVIRFTLPNADPYLFPLVAVLACFGLVVIYRLDEDLAREQAQWFVFGLALFAGTISCCCTTSACSSGTATRSPRGPAAAGDAAAAGHRPAGQRRLPRRRRRPDLVPAGRVRQDRDRHLPRGLPARARDELIVGARRFMGITFPPLKHFGPLVVIWGAAMVMLFLIRDIGSSLMFFGGFLAVLYVATNRLAFVSSGWLFSSAPGSSPTRRHVQDRVDIWLDPFAATRDEARRLPDRPEPVRAGRRRAVRDRLRPGADRAGRRRSILPAPHTDLIYAVISNELGLAGACGLILVYLLLAERGFKTAMIARDSFSKLLAAGLTAVLALQVFVIVGGVTRVIPLTGVTLPFVSYGGSSILANFVLLALLLLVSDRARRR